MDRAQHLEFCKVCVQRKFDTSQGLICSLTNEPADFEEECPDFKLDGFEAQRLERKSKERELKLAKDATSFAGLGAKSVIWIGFMLFLVGIAWIFMSRFYVAIIAYYGIIPLAIGLFVIAYGMNKRVAELRAKKKRINTPT